MELRNGRIGEIMIALGYIDRLTLLKHLEMQKRARKRLGEIFVENNYINNEELNYILKIQREAA